MKSLFLLSRFGDSAVIAQMASFLEKISEHGLMYFFGFRSFVCAWTSVVECVYLCFHFCVRICVCVNIHGRFFGHVFLHVSLHGSSLALLLSSALPFIAPTFGDRLSPLHVGSAGDHWDPFGVGGRSLPVQANHQRVVPHLRLW